MDKNEAANVVWGQMMKGLERFAVDLRLHRKGKRKLGKAPPNLRVRTLRSCGGGILRRPNPFGGTSLCGIVAIFLS